MDARETHTDVRRFRGTRKIKSKDKGKSWIPAFAGITKLGFRQDDEMRGFAGTMKYCPSLGQRGLRLSLDNEISNIPRNPATIM